MAVSLVFQGEDIQDVNGKILEYVGTTKVPAQLVGVPTGIAEEPEKKAAPAKKAKKKAAANTPEDPMDLFGDDEPAGETEAETEGDDPFGATDPTIEDVKNALGAVVSAWDEKNNTGAEKAQKILQVYGDADDLGSLDESLYRKVIANSDLVAEKANG